MHASLSIAQWRDMTPEAGGAEFRRRLAALPVAARRAALAWIPEPDALQAEWRVAAGPLAGVPFAIKDLFDLAGVTTRAGSRLLGEIGRPAARDATLVATLRGLGAVAAAKTHLHEFAYGLTGINPHHGDTPHPGFPDRLAGGSSSGSAWAVAADLVPVALGTDTAGSVRVPAAFCGLHGLRWAQNGWQREGVFPLSPSFDAAGWFTRGAEDMIAFTEILAGRSPDRPLRGAVLPMAHLVRDPVLAAALETRWRDWGLRPDPSLADRLAGAFAGSGEAYAVLNSREALGIHRAWLDPHRELYDPAVWPLIDRARRWTPTQIAAAEATRNRVTAAWQAFFAQHDFLVLPAAHAVAPRREDLTDDFRPALLALTTPASIAALPALTVPVPLPGGLSGGLQIVFRADRPGDAAAFLRAFGA